MQALRARASLVIVGLVGLSILCAGCRGGTPEPTPTLFPITDISQPAVGISPTSDKFATAPAQTDTPAMATLVAAPPPTRKPQPAGSPVPGIEIDSNEIRELEMALQAGAFWIRRNALIWSAVEPQEGERRWEALAGLDAELVHAAQAGAQVVLVVRSTPTWAQKIPGTYCGPVKEDKIGAFAQFVYDLVARYSAPPYSVKYWEFGNEPDIDPSLVVPDSLYGCWGDANDLYYGGGYYASVLKEVYPQVRRADPSAQVLVGGLLLDCDPVNPPEGKNCSPSLFLEGILRQGGGDFFDGISFHAYDYYAGPGQYYNPNWDSSWDTTGPVVIAKARYLRSVLNANGHPEKYLLNTEAGLLCGRDGSEASCRAQEFDQTKAAYVAQLNVVSLAEALRASIWYSLTGWRGSGLVSPDFNPLPAYEAFRFSAAQLKGAAVTRTITDYPGVSGYELYRNGRRAWFLLSTDGKSHTIGLPDVPLKVYDVYGAALDATQEIEVTAMPLYIELK